MNSDKTGVLDGLGSLNIPSRNKGNNKKAEPKKGEPAIGDTFTLPLDKIQTAEQVRTKFSKDSISELAHSIKMEGQRTPLEVAKLETDKYLLITGERRYLALRMTETDSARVTLVPMPKDEVAKIVTQLTENIQREDLSPLDLASAFDRLKIQAFTTNQIAKLVGKSAAWVSRYTSLIGLPDYLKRLLEEEHTSDTQMVAILRKIADHNEETAKKLAIKVEQGKIGRQQAQDIYKALKIQAENPDSEESTVNPVDIKATHYNRKHHLIKPDQFVALVEARLSDGSKINGRLMTDRLAAANDQEQQDDWCWIKIDTGTQICVEAKKVKLLQILSK